MVGRDKKNQVEVEMGYPNYDTQEAMESFASPDYLFYGKLHIVELLYL